MALKNFSDKYLGTLTLSSVSAFSILIDAQSSQAAQLYNNYKYPWGSTLTWVLTQDAHDPSLSHEGKFALDFAPLGTTTNVDILAPAPAIAKRICAGSQNQAFISLETVINGQGSGEIIQLGHLDAQTLTFSDGEIVQQGQKLGQMLGSSKSDSCGQTQGPHIHIELPTLTNQQITIDGDTWVDNKLYFDNNGNSTQNPSVSTNTSNGNNGSNNNPILNPKEYHLTIVDGSVTIKSIRNGVPREEPFVDFDLTQGDSLITVSNGVDATGLAFRDAPGGNFLGRIPWGEVGVFLEGPVTESFGGISYNWLKSDWGNNQIGWSAESHLNYVYKPGFMMIMNTEVTKFIETEEPIQQPIQQPIQESNSETESESDITEEVNFTELENETDPTPIPENNTVFGLILTVILGGIFSVNKKKLNTNK